MDPSTTIAIISISVSGATALLYALSKTIRRSSCFGSTIDFRDPNQQGAQPPTPNKFSFFQKQQIQAPRIQIPTPPPPLYKPSSQFLNLSPQSLEMVQFPEPKL